jgi:Phosphatidylinositol-4-phosphate 5-kinase
MAELTAHNVPKNIPRRSVTKDDKFVSFGHHNWNLVLNMMLGIQMAVKSVVENPGPVTAKDFQLKYVFELVPRRTKDLRTFYTVCKFFDYAPAVFDALRKLYGIKNDDYLRSIGPETMLNNLIMGNLKTLSELTSSGKSGSFFYYSADGKYTLKTISRQEFHFLKRILRNYYDHLVQNPNSLIIK